MQDAYTGPIIFMPDIAFPPSLALGEWVGMAPPYLHPACDPDMLCRKVWIAIFRPSSFVFYKILYINIMRRWGERPLFLPEWKKAARKRGATRVLT